MPTIPENLATIIDKIENIEHIALTYLPYDKGRVLSHCKAIREAAENCRRRPQHRGPVKSDPMTPAKKQHIKSLRASYPDWSLQQIAVASKVNLARVSEVLFGKRR